MKMVRSALPIFLTLIVACLSAPATFAATKIWTGEAGDTLWSTGQNWSPAGAPGPADNVTFTNLAVTDLTYANSGPTTDAVDAAFGGKINSLRFSNITGYHNTSLDKALLVESSSSSDVAFVADDGHVAAFFVGSGQADGAADSVYASFAGDSLTVNNSNADVSVTQASATSGAHRATLDMSALNSFTCAVSNVLVGHDFGDPITRPTGTLILANSNTITAKMISIADAYQNAGQASFMALGAQNVLNVDRIRVGSHKCVGTLWMREGLTEPTVKMRGIDGVGPQLSWEIGDEYEPNTALGYFTSSQSTGTLDFTGATVDAFVDKIVLGRGQTNAPTRTGDGNGTLTFGGGVINAGRVEMGIQLSGGGSAGRGTLNLNNDAGNPAKLRVAGDLLMGVQLAGNTEATGSTATINVNGGILEVAGNAIDGGGNVTLNIAGGTVDMMPEGDTTPGNIGVDVLNISAGELIDYGTFSVSKIAMSDAITDFTVGAGRTISPAGDAVGTLDVTGGELRLQGKLLLDVRKSGGTRTADVITGTVIYGGALEVRASGDALVVGDKFTLFSAPMPAGTFSTVALPSAGPGLAFVNKLAENGTIEVIASGEPTDPPLLTITSAANAVTISWPSAYTSFVLRAQTNTVSVGVGSNWGLVPGVTGNQIALPLNPANGVVLFQLIQQ